MEKPTKKKPGRPKGTKNKQYIEDQDQKNRGTDLNRRLVKDRRKNKENILYTSLFIAVISLIGLLIVGSMSNKLKSDINQIKEITITSLDKKVTDLAQKVDTTQQHISTIIDLSIKNGEKIISVEKFVDNIETRVVTAQKGVNRLARTQLINLGYNDSLSFIIANEISVNPTKNKWDKLISNSKFNLKKLNENINSLDESQLADSVNMVKINEEVSNLQKLLDKKHQIVLNLLKAHGTKKMKKQLNK